MVMAAVAAHDIPRVNLPALIRGRGAACRSEIACLACGGDEVVPLAPRTRDRAGFGVVGCARCGLARLNPLPSGTAAYYQAAYREETGLDLHAIRCSDTDDSARRWQALMPRLAGSPTLLDVGVGSGAFLSHIRPRTQAALVGVEPHAGFQQTLRAEHLDIRPSLEDIPDGSVDVATLFHVLEHVESPRILLQRLRRVLKPGGTLVIEVPNLADALLWVYRVKAFWSFYWQFPHLWYFSPGPLRRLVELEGYGVDRLQGVQRYGLRNHLQWLTDAAPGPGDQFRPLIPDEVDVRYRAALIDQDVFDTIWMECTPH